MIRVFLRFHYTWEKKINSFNDILQYKQVKLHSSIVKLLRIIEGN